MFSILHIPNKHLFLTFFSFPASSCSLCPVFHVLLSLRQLLIISPSLYVFLLALFFRSSSLPLSSDVLLLIFYTFVFPSYDWLFLSCSLGQRKGEGKQNSYDNKNNERSSSNDDNNNDGDLARPTEIATLHSGQENKLEGECYCRQLPAKLSLDSSKCSHRNQDQQRGNIGQRWRRWRLSKVTMTTPRP